MRILYPSAYFQPENTAFSHLDNDLLTALTDAGYEFEVICPTPTRGISEEVRRQYKKCKEEYLYNGAVHVRRFWAPRERKNPVIRALRYFWCNFRTYQIGKKFSGIDLVLAWSTPPTQGLVAGYLKKRLNCSFIYNLQDIFPDSLVNTGLTNNGSMLWKIGRKVEDATYRSADQIVVISKDFQNNLMKKGIQKEKTTLIYNWINEENVYAVPRNENKLYDKYDMPRDRFYVSYCGNIGHTQNMDMLLDVAKMLQGEREDIGFIIVGDGACRQHIERRIEEEMLNNVRLLPFQPYEDISLVFSLGDVGLLVSKSGIGNNSVPGKTWTYLSAQRPVLASFDLDSELCELLKMHKCGVCVEPDNSIVLKDAIIDLADQPEKLQEMGKRGREFIMNSLTAKICTGKWLKLLNDFDRN